MDSDILSTLGVRIGWVGDRVSTRADFKPRHVGRPVTFEWVTEWIQGDSVGESTPVSVMGTFEGFEGENVQVSGTDYRWSDMQNVKVHRKVVGQQ